MKAVVQDLIDVRNPQSFQEYDRALRELIQHLVLLGLWRAGFFESAFVKANTRYHLHLTHLEERMRQSGDWQEERNVTIEDLPVFRR